jgi:DNA-binding response OmpR family regulator
MPEENGSRRTQQKGEILLVDDDDRFRGILKEFLELRGFSVVTAGSGEDALGCLAEHAPSVVLLDMKMPGMDGVLTLKHIRMRKPNLPVIIVTSSDEEHTKQEAVVLGSNDYLLKPFNFDYLETILLTRIFA